MATCPQCGAPVDAGATECKYCGEKLAVQQPAAPQFQQPSQQQFQQQFQQPTTQNFYVQTPNNGINPAWPIKSKVVAGILAILLGFIGVHKFYLGKVGLGIVYLLFSFTGIPAIVGFIEGIVYLTSNDHNFQVKNQVRLN